jgi:isocitrate/isopropylmalate dehydrogenase
VERVLAAGHTTRDMGGTLSTTEVGDRVVEAMED